MLRSSPGGADEAAGAAAPAPAPAAAARAYGYPDTNPGVYEEDHLISLELGGAARDQRNLWPEPGHSPNSKDRVENVLHSRVCAGTLALAEAQRRIATDWTTATR